MRRIRFAFPGGPRPSERRSLHMGEGSGPRPRRRIPLAVATAAVSLSTIFALSACGTGTSVESITVAGSTTCLPIAEQAAELFKEETGVGVLVSGLGSSAGIEAVSTGTAEIATSSRGLNAQERELGLTTIPVAHDGIAVIVNTENPVRDLNVEQLRAIYSGEVSNWSEVGGEDLPIQLVNRDEASGTREAFKSIVMDGSPFDRRAAVLSGTGQVRDVVSRSRGAIGYISMGFVESKYAQTSVRALGVNGVAPSEDTIATGEYPISRDLYFFTKGEPSGAAARGTSSTSCPPRWTGRSARRASSPSSPMRRRGHEPDERAARFP